MSQTGHVIVIANGPATTLSLRLEYGAAVDIYECLAAAGMVEANAEFGWAARPESAPAEFMTMVKATPGYMEMLAGQLETMLNNVIESDVCTFIEAMMDAGTPEQMTEIAWNQVWGVYEAATGPSTNAEELTCIEARVCAPGQPCP